MQKGALHVEWSCGREAEGGGLLNRYRVVKPYRGFESLRLRHSLLKQGRTLNAHRTAGNGGAGSVDGPVRRSKRSTGPFRSLREPQLTRQKSPTGDFWARGAAKRRAIRDATASRTSNMRLRIFDAIPPALPFPGASRLEIAPPPGFPATRKARGVRGSRKSTGLARALRAAAHPSGSAKPPNNVIGTYPMSALRHRRSFRACHSSPSQLRTARTASVD